jgi:hypothetical protein
MLMNVKTRCMSILEPLKRITEKYHPLIAMTQVDCISTQVEKVSLPSLQQMCFYMPSDFIGF